MPVSIKDIARQLNLSHTTVSRALRGSPLISEQTTARVRQAALELGYRPSAAARSLKTNRTQALGVIVSSIADPFFSEILQGIDEVAQSHGYSLFIAASQRDPQRERAIVQTMVEHRVDGVIVCSTPFSPAHGRQLLRYGVPIAVVNNQAAEDFRYSIYHDDMDGSRQITRYLISLGHRRIAYLGNSLSGRTTLDRLSGFRMEIETARLEVPPEFIHQVPGGGADDGLAGGRYFLNLPDLPTALVCFNDMLAIGVLQALQQAGISVPGECSVTGFDNISFSAFTMPPLTTFDQPKRHIGAEATRLILGLLEQGPQNRMPDQPEIRVLPGRLLVRASSAPPPAGRQ